MRTINASVQAAMSARSYVVRDLIYLIPKDRITGLPHEMGFWSGLGTRTFNVIDALTRATVARSFIGSGTLISIDAIPLVSNLSVRQVSAKLSQVDDSVEQAVRSYDIRNAPVQIYRAWLSTDTRSLIDAAVPRFVGFVNRCEINTPQEGEFGSIDFTLVSHTRELTRSSPLLKSNEALLARAPGDGFRKDRSSVGDWTVFWGKDKRQLSTAGGRSGR